MYAFGLRKEHSGLSTCLHTEDTSLSPNTTYLSPKHHLGPRSTDYCTLSLSNCWSTELGLAPESFQVWHKHVQFWKGNKTSKRCISLLGLLIKILDHLFLSVWFLNNPFLKLIILEKNGVKYKSNWTSMQGPSPVVILEGRFKVLSSRILPYRPFDHFPQDTTLLSEVSL